MAEYANRKSGQVESLVMLSVGSTPTSATANRAMVRFEHRPQGGRGSVKGLRCPDGPLGEINMGGWSNGKTPGLQPGDRGPIPRPVHLMRRDGLMVQRDEQGPPPTDEGGERRPAVDCFALAWRRSKARLSVDPLNTEGIRTGSGNCLLGSCPTGLGVRFSHLPLVGPDGEMEIMPCF